MLSWELVKIIIYWIIIINAVIAFFTVFREKRDIAATWAWLLVLVFIPVGGFIAYAFLGRKLPHKRLAKIQNEQRLELSEALTAQKKELSQMHTDADDITSAAKGMVTLFQNADHAFLTRQNRIKIFTEGNALFHDMLEDIEAATDSVHIEFYTFYNDKIGNEILHLLERKAKSGLEVRVIYDSWGSMGTKRSFFNTLRENGGHAEPFLGTHSNFMDFRLNFRDHRKIVVVDGRIGYVGGFNIGDQYLDRSEKFGHWRDTHLRIVGGGVFSLQQRFIRDWNATISRNKITNYRQYFPINHVKGETSLQIVASGPDNDMEKIKLGYLKLINSARHNLWIQSPYLIPDDSVLDALRVAALSGVDVRIMVPNMPDHAFVYRATQYYAKQLAHEGIKIYFYTNGFIHAKTMVVDGKMASVGSANMDFRSFKLNFEINTFIYDPKVTSDLEKIFEADMKQSIEMTTQKFSEQSLWLRFKQTFSRLLSPIL
jgi:cardiolipin synthase